MISKLVYYWHVQCELRPKGRANETLPLSFSSTPFSGYFIALTTLPFQKQNRVHRLPTPI